MNQTNTLLASALLMLMALPPATAVTVDDIEFPDQLAAGELEMRVVGAGKYEKYFFDVYANALYLPAGIEPKKALDDVPRCLLFHYFREIKAEQLVEAGENFLRENLDGETLEQIQPQLEQLRDVYETVQDGDRYLLCYLPGTGTTLAFNGEPADVIEGAAFAHAYFQIWLGKHAVSNDLRDQLLGQDN